MEPAVDLTLIPTRKLLHSTKAPQALRDSVPAARAAALHDLSTAVRGTRRCQDGVGTPPPHRGATPREKGCLGLRRPCTLQMSCGCGTPTR